MDNRLSQLSGIDPIGFDRALEGAHLKAGDIDLASACSSPHYESPLLSPIRHAWTSAGVETPSGLKGSKVGDWLEALASPDGLHDANCSRHHIIP